MTALLPSFYATNKNRSVRHLPTEQRLSFNPNFGPQHFSARGVLHLILQLNGESVQKAPPNVGPLHSKTGTPIEYKTYLQALSFFA